MKEGLNIVFLGARIIRYLLILYALRDMDFYSGTLIEDDFCNLSLVHVCLGYKLTILKSKDTSAAITKNIQGKRVRTKGKLDVGCLVHINKCGCMPCYLCTLTAGLVNYGVEDVLQMS